MQSQLRCAKLHVHELQQIWRNIIWTGEVKVDKISVYCKKSFEKKNITAYQNKSLILTTKHEG